LGILEGWTFDKIKFRFDSNRGREVVKVGARVELFQEKTKEEQLGFMIEDF
jgi:hypothetical protein